MRLRIILSTTIFLVALFYVMGWCGVMDMPVGTWDTPEGDSGLRQLTILPDRQIVMVFRKMKAPEEVVVTASYNVHMMKWDDYADVTVKIHSIVQRPLNNPQGQTREKKLTVTKQLKQTLQVGKGSEFSFNFGMSGFEQVRVCLVRKSNVECETLHDGSKEPQPVPDWWPPDERPHHQPPNSPPE